MSSSKAAAVTASPRKPQEDTTDLPSQDVKAPPPLPLDWTRVQRKRPRLEQGQRYGDEAQANDYCDCTDPSCLRAPRPLFQGNQGDPSTTTLKGHVVVCLHDINPDWFQGYFFTPTNPKPWGLLAEHVEIDECLQCADGGYRQVRLTVYPYGDLGLEAPLVCDVVEWTGGDLMRLQGATVRMQPLVCYTGKKAVPHVERIFCKLLTKVRTDAACENDDTNETSLTDVLDLIPNVAVITGTMELVVPVVERDTLTADDLLFDD